MQKRKEPRAADVGTKFEDGPTGIKLDDGRSKAVYGSKKQQRSDSPEEEFKFKDYRPEDFDENEDEYDQKLIDSLQDAPLPFPLRKLFYDEVMGGNYYVFGSKIILLRVNASGSFVV